MGCSILWGRLLDGEERATTLILLHWGPTEAGRQPQLVPNLHSGQLPHFLAHPNPQPLGRHDRSNLQRPDWKNPTFDCSGSPLPVTQSPVKRGSTVSPGLFPRGVGWKNGKEQSPTGQIDRKGIRKLKTFFWKQQKENLCW